MDPQPAGQPWKNHSAPVQTQPQWQNAQSLQLSNPRAVVPPGLNCLVEVEEVTLHKKAFFTRSEQTLFTIRRESECCGPAFNLILQDPKKRDVVSLCTNSGEGCCGGDTHLNIMVLPSHMIGFVQILNSSRKMRVSIQMQLGEPAFTAELPLSGSQNTIEILSVNGSCPVAKIIKEGERKSSKVIFQFPMDMEATLKTIILAAFLYMRYQLSKTSDSSSSDFDSGWSSAGGVLFFSDDHGGFSDHGGYDGDCGGGGDWGGGGDCGGGGGDCGGGGGDCGGGGGDCGGGCD
ncbi:phospholipid scramblase 3-like [Phyllobates terribilis]|uniref:phospholipid scramblase 3-like n=1 Tax=Phyllobates terribilis TaxID=111132 RepID=UPI003CCAD274